MYLIVEWAERRLPPAEIAATLRAIQDAVERGEVEGTFDGSLWRLGPLDVVMRSED